MKSVQCLCKGPYLTANCPRGNNTIRIALPQWHISSGMTIEARTVEALIKVSMTLVDQ